MKFAVGADHRGLAFKNRVIGILKRLGHEVTDFGTYTEESTDYPDHGFNVAHAVADGEADYGVTVCWTGNGMNIVANKVKGVRAGMALNADMAFLTRKHNDANVLTLAAKYTPEDQLEEIVTAFVETNFEGGRHAARVERIKQEEES